LRAPRQIKLAKRARVEIERLDREIYVLEARLRVGTASAH